VGHGRGAVGAWGGGRGHCTAFLRVVKENRQSVGSFAVLRGRWVWLACVGGLTPIRRSSRPAWWASIRVSRGRAVLVARCVGGFLRLALLGPHPKLESHPSMPQQPFSNSL
jgi:hypothetical protein